MDTMYQSSTVPSGAPETIAIPFVLPDSKEQSPWSQNSGGEGQLALDVLETTDDLVVVATLAGTQPQDVSLHLDNDLLTIRGVRQRQVRDLTGVFYEECYWGPFSRTIVLPMDVDQESARAEYRSGVLTVRLRKIVRAATIPLLVIEE